MSGLWPLSAPCPWCGETVEVLLDGPADTAERVEDCAVCCQPIVVRVEIAAEGQLALRLLPEGR